MDFQNRNNTPNKFVCPSDRQLALRAKLRAGWSCSKSNEPLRPEEQEAIISVIKRNEEIEYAERQRVGRLVERVEKIKQHAVERGPNCCRLCGDTFGLLRPQRIICEDCKKAVCTKCSVDINIRYHTSERTREIWLCRICSETREMWKKSGAWFFKGLPNYEMPRSANVTPTHHHPNQQYRQQQQFGLRSGSLNLMDGIRTTQSCQNTPIRMQRVKKLTIHVNDSSSSSDSDLEDVNNAAYNCTQTVSNLMSTQTSATITAAATAATTVTAASAAINTDVQHLQREDSFRMRTFGSLRSFIDGNERKITNSFFFNRQTSKSDSSQPDYDSISTASTLATNISTSLAVNGSSSSTAITVANAGLGRRESSYFLRRSSVSSSWSISDSSAGSANSGGSALTNNGQSQLNQHYRDQLLGWLEIAIVYRENFHSLDCTMVRARDLPATDASGLTDPYCKLNIVTPEANTKYTRWQRTKTVHKTRNPEFNETLQFVGVEPEELGNSLLYVAIFDEDKYGHDFLGAAKVCLSTVHSSNQYRISVPLGVEDQYSHEAELAQVWPNGKILLSLCYNAKKRALIVNIKQCICLLPMDNNGSSDPFVKLQLKPDRHKNKKHKTSVKWRTLNPVFNEEFHFEASPHDLNKETLIITVWDKDIGKSNDFLGSLQIGYQSKGERLQQWHDCIRLPDHFHEKWHCLSAENPTH